MESRQAGSAKAQSNVVLKLYSVLWVSVFISTFEESPSWMLPYSTFTSEFSESPLEPFCMENDHKKSRHSNNIDWHIDLSWWLNQWRSIIMAINTN